MTGTRDRRISRVLLRLLDERRKWDYLWAFLFAVSPLIVAAALGIAGDTADGYTGYLGRPNWMSLIVLVPVGLFGLRWFYGRIAPVSSQELTDRVPSVIKLIKTEQGRQRAYEDLRAALLAPLNLWSTLGINAVIHVLDMAWLRHFYFGSPDPTAHANASRDWTVAFLSETAGISRNENLALIASAYAAQFAIIFIGVLFAVLMLRHNLYFLSRIYQRRKVPPGEAQNYIHLDLDDPEKCFGMRIANRAFNYQIMALFVAACFILATRFANVSPELGLFPTAGQVLAVAVWALASLVVSLPILVKLLPRLPAPGHGETPHSLVGYLQEFLPDEVWLVDERTSRDEVNEVAAQFAQHAFWPTGNNRAWQLYFMSFWVFWIVLVPDPRAQFDNLGVWSVPVNFIFGGVVAAALTWLLFWGLDRLINFVDERLVSSAAAATGTHERRHAIPFGIFISYRRDDSGPYTGRLYDSLSRYMDSRKIFRDIYSIDDADDFIDAVDRAIRTAEAMLVVIGPQWLSVADDSGEPRLHQPDDFVRQEVALGLERDLRVLPVLVGGAKMPSASDLPEELRGLARLNARELSDTRWDYDVERLVAKLSATGRVAQPGGPQDTDRALSLEP